MSRYLDIATGPTPQNRPLPGQVPNSAGGHAYAVSDIERLHRFLILGSEGGSYYAGERDLTLDNVDAVKRTIAANWKVAVDLAVSVSVSGRAPKNDPAILVLALATTDLGARVDSQTRGEFVKFDADTTRRHYLADAVASVCRTGTHLMRYVSFVDQLRGWGPAVRRIVENWYLDRSPDDLAMQMLKYRNRYGWTHHDIMHMAHPAFTTKEHKALAKWAKDGKVRKNAPNIIHAYDKLAGADLRTQAAIITSARLPREALPTESLKSPEVWEALHDNMPITATIRNLANMTRVGLLVPGSDATRNVVTRLTDAERLRRGRVHPISVLTALLTYKAGHSLRSRTADTWNPGPAVLDALDEAFYLSFGNLERVDKSVLLALDVSGSMCRGEVAGVPGFSPRIAAAAMALVTIGQYRDVTTIGFTTTEYNLDVTRRRRLDDVIRDIDLLTSRKGTDCSVPVQSARRRRAHYDAIHMYTDSETYAGLIHPAEALDLYRREGNENAKCIVVGLVANKFTVANEHDPLSLNVVGFDTSAPNVMAQFTAS